MRKKLGDAKYFYKNVEFWREMVKLVSGQNLSKKRKKNKTFSMSSDFK